MDLDGIMRYSEEKIRYLLKYFPVVAIIGGQTSWSNNKSFL